MEKIRKHIQYDDIGTGKGHYNTMYGKSVYEFEYPDGKMEQQTMKIIVETMLSKVYSGGHLYQVLNEVTDHKRYKISITKVDGFTKSINGKLHRKRTTRVCKLLAKW